MVVQRRCALIESASVPRIRKSEPLEVKMMAKFVAEGAHERAEGSDFLPHRRPHPHADQHALRIVVAEKFTRPVFADSQRSGREHADTACWCSVELRGGYQKLCTVLGGHLHSSRPPLPFRWILHARARARPVAGQAP